jgi:hypothetical protein
MHRKALGRGTKRLVEDAHKEALDGCVEQHRKRRVLVTHVSGCDKAPACQYNVMQLRFGLAAAAMQCCL